MIQVLYMLKVSPLENVDGACEQKIFCKGFPSAVLIFGYHAK